MSLRPSAPASVAPPSLAGLDRTSARALAALVALFALTVEVSTDTPKLGPFFKLFPATQLSSAVTAGVLALVALALLLPWRPPRARLTASPWWGRLARVGRLVVAGAAVGALLWTRSFVLKEWAPIWNPFAVVSVAGLVVAALAFRSTLPLAGVALLVGIGVRWVHLRTHALEQGNDMLPLTQAALTNLFAGKSPYATYALPGPLPLTYYPLTFLAYAPAHLLGFDLRWTNVAAEVALAAAVMRARPWTSAPRGPELTVWSLVFLLPSSIYFDRITTAPVGWAALAWMLVLVVADRRAAPYAVGLAAATTPLAVVFAPLVAVAWWRQGGLRALARHAAIALAVAAVVIAPFVLWAPRDFFDGAVLWFNDLDRFPRTKWVRFRTWLRYVGLSGLLWEAGAEGWLKPLQAAGVALSTLAFALLRARPVRLFRFAAVAFTSFMIVNPVLWPYFYQPALWCGVCAVAVAWTAADARALAQAEAERLRLAYDATLPALRLPTSATS